MLEFWAVGLPILLVDVANPVLLAMVLLALATDRPFLNSIMLILGHTLAYFLAGVAILYGLAEALAPILKPIWHQILNPQSIDYFLGLLLGVLLLVLAIRWKASPPDPNENSLEGKDFGPISAFLTGGLVNFIGMPFAVPYIAFLNQAGKLPSDETMGALVVYNIGYALPFLLVPVAAALAGPSIIPVFDRIMGWVEAVSGLIMPLLLGALGAGMIVDAVLFFATGQGLI